MKILFWIIFFIVCSILFLFREPILTISSRDNIITSPAYGKIYKIQKKNNYIYISIILTIFDVHFQYVPCDGYVRKITYDNNGIFNIVLNDYRKSRYNEKMIYEIESKHGKIFVYQIAGFFFRRTISYINENTYVSKGDKLGLITFGSRVDICFPSTNFKLNIIENQSVKGGQELGYYLM